jgi:ribosomal protein S18
MDIDIKEILKNIAYLFLILLIGIQVFADELTAKQILIKAKEVQQVPASWSIAEQTIITSGGSKRTFLIETWTKDKNDKQLMIYKKPARVKGIKFLFLEDGDEIYTYFPKTDRVRHLASHMKRQKMMGSDFSYEDMTFGDIEEDYKLHKLLRSEEEGGVGCYVVEVIPSEYGPHYSKMIIWIQKSNFVTRKIDYYEDGDLLKRFIAERVKLIDNIPTPLDYSMKNLIDGGYTSIITNEIKYDVNPSDTLFTVRSLKRR